MHSSGINCTLAVPKRNLFAFAWHGASWCVTFIWCILIWLVSGHQLFSVCDLLSSWRSLFGWVWMLSVVHRLLSNLIISLIFYALCYVTMLTWYFILVQCTIKNSLIYGLTWMSTTLFHQVKLTTMFSPKVINDPIEVFVISAGND